jgi:hypothetical protein
VTARTASPPLVRIRPRAGLLGTAAATSLLVTSPLFGVLYWFAVPSGNWPVVLAAHVLVLIGCVLVGARQLTVFAEVRDGRLVGNGIFSPTEVVELDRIAVVDLVGTYVGLKPAPVPQLLVRDAEGRRLFRLRGNFWHPGDLERIAEALPVPTTTASEPVDLKEFFRRYPGSAYWFENRPALLVAAIVLGVVAVAAVAAATIAVTGEPFFA